MTEIEAGTPFLVVCPKCGAKTEQRIMAHDGNRYYGPGWTISAAHACPQEARP